MSGLTQIRGKFQLEIYLNFKHIYRLIKLMIAVVYITVCNDKHKTPAVSHQGADEMSRTVMTCSHGRFRPEAGQIGLRLDKYKMFS